MSAMGERLDKIGDICRGLRFEIQSPHDSSVEDALFEILQALRELDARHSYGPELTQPAQEEGTGGAK